MSDNGISVLAIVLGILIPLIVISCIAVIVVAFCRKGTKVSTTKNDYHYPEIQLAVLQQQYLYSQQRSTCSALNLPPNGGLSITKSEELSHPPSKFHLLSLPPHFTSSKFRYNQADLKFPTFSPLDSPSSFASDDSLLDDKLRDFEDETVTTRVGFVRNHSRDNSHSSNNSFSKRQFSSIGSSLVLNNTTTASATTSLTASQNDANEFKLVSDLSFSRMKGSHVDAVLNANHAIETDADLGQPNFKIFNEIIKFSIPTFSLCPKMRTHERKEGGIWMLKQLRRGALVSSSTPSLGPPTRRCLSPSPTVLRGDMPRGGRVVFPVNIDNMLKNVSSFLLIPRPCPIDRNPSRVYCSHQGRGGPRDFRYSLFVANHPGHSRWSFHWGHSKLSLVAPSP